MSAIVWSGTAQFAALSVLTSGGGTALAASTGLLANIRFLPMGFAIAPSMEAKPLRRLLTAAVLADASFVIAHRGGGRFDINALAWAAPVQYVAWLGGTIAGVAGAGAIGDPSRWGSMSCFRCSISRCCCRNCSPSAVRARTVDQQGRAGARSSCR